MSEPSPAVEVQLVLDAAQLHWPAPLRATVTLVNGSAEPLASINPECENGAPILLMWELESGRMQRYVEPTAPGTLAPEVDVPAGARRQWRVDLSKDVAKHVALLPGRYELVARLAWKGGEASSAAVTITVRGTRPRQLCRETLTGGFAGDTLCAYVDADGPAGLAWLARVDTSGWPRCVAATALGPAPADRPLTLSVPAHALATRQYLAWVDGAELAWIAHAHGRVHASRARTPWDRFELVAPLLEDPFTPERPQLVDALLLRVGAVGLELRRATLGARPDFGPVLAVPGRAPQYARTAYGSGGQRITLLAQPASSQQGEPSAVELSCMCWAYQRDPVDILSVGTIAGVLVSADMAVLANDTIAGAAVFAVPSRRGGTRYACWRFALSFAGEIAGQPSVWLSDGFERRRTRVRVDARGSAWLVSVDAAGHVLLEDDAGGVRPIDIPPLRDDSPIDLIFAEQTIPVLVWSKPGVGLQFHPLGPVARQRPAPG